MLIEFNLSLNIIQLTYAIIEQRSIFILIEIITLLCKLFKHSKLYVYGLTTR